MNKHLGGLGVLAIIFSILLTFSTTVSFSAASDDGYNEGYYEGWLEGIKKAENDIVKDNDKSYSRAMPSNDEIIKKYRLNMKNNRYKNAFIDGFNDGFKNGYSRTYSTSNNEKDIDDDKIKEYEHSIVLGLAMGETYGHRDYYEGKTNKWSSAIPSNSKIVEIFELKKETNDYRIAFIDIFKSNFKEGYEKGYRKAKFEPFEDSFDQGSRDGKYFGRLLGEIYGVRDYYSGRNNDWKRNLPTRLEMISSFSLNNDSKEYQDAFVEAFVYAFEEKYNDIYRSENLSIIELTYENGYKQGKEVGIIRGEGFANMDLLLEQSSNLLRYSINELENINEFKLYLENEQYKEGFISGYNEGLNEGYIKAYQNLNLISSLAKLATKVIPISGGEIYTEDKKISIKINKGTYYNDVAVSIDGLLDTNDWHLPPKDKFIKTSEVYTIKVSNSSYQFDNDKSIELSFEYYGSQSGGVYKNSNNTWIYLPSEISGNRIITYIKPSSLNSKGGMYAVFIDTDVKNIKDIRGHWAKDEISTYVRRGIAGLFGDDSFKPDTPITRGQLLGLLSRVYNWNFTNLDASIRELEKLYDYQILADYKDLAAYSLKNAYMELYPDNTFKVYNTVTYKQLENIMKKITGDKNFSWSNIANSIMSNKDTRSKSYNSMDNNVTRAEAVYMLYLINEWEN